MTRINGWVHLDRPSSLVSSLRSSRRCRASSFQAQHAAAQSTISAFESKVTPLESLFKAQATPLLPPIEGLESTEPPLSESLTQVLADWKKSVEGRWSSVREEWASGAQTTRARKGRMGVEGESHRDQPWDDCGKVRCGVSASRGVAAAPTTTTTADESAVGIGEVGRASHASHSAKFEC